VGFYSLSPRHGSAIDENLIHENNCYPFSCLVAGDAGSGFCRRAGGEKCRWAHSASAGGGFAAGGECSRAFSWESLTKFHVADDLVWEQVLAEPRITQPAFLNFDARGRMWVVEYRQYLSPAGLKMISQRQRLAIGL
jgi:hypothetical protein